MILCTEKMMSGRAEGEIQKLIAERGASHVPPCTAAVFGE